MFQDQISYQFGVPDNEAHLSQKYPERILYAPKKLAMLKQPVRDYGSSTFPLTSIG